MSGPHGYVGKFELLSAACRDVSLSRGALAVFSVILARFNERNGCCWPGVTLIAQESCIDRRNAIRALKALEERGWIEVERAFGKSNTYKVRHPTGDTSATSDADATSGAHVTSDESVTRDTSVTELVASASLELVASAPPEYRKRTPKGTPKEKKHVSEEPLTLPTWLSPDLWDTWCKYRKAKSGKGFTRFAEELNLRKLVALQAQGFDPKRVIENAIEMTWTGLFPPKDTQKSGTRSNFSGADYSRVPDYLAGAV